MLLKDGTEFKLDPEFKAQWLEALRSGAYQQTEQTLYHAYHNREFRDEIHFCCLGVAFHLFKGDILAFPDTDDTDKACDIMHIPQEVQKQLVIFNDDKKWSFSRIADWVEENL